MRDFRRYQREAPRDLRRDAEVLVDELAGIDEEVDAEVYEAELRGESTDSLG